LDFDSDNDGIFDSVEMGLTSEFLSNNTNISKGCFIADADPKTTTDMTKIDSDNDTWPDGQEDLNGNGKYEPELGEMDPTLKDFDNDGLEDDNQDQDDDGDGYYDVWENVLGTDPLDAEDVPLDTDDDGNPDGDSDNTQYWMDKDDDNDNVTDYDENLAGTDPKNPNSKPVIDNNGPETGDDEDDSETGFNLMLIVVIIIVIIVIIVVVIAVALGRKKSSSPTQGQISQPAPSQSTPSQPPTAPIQTAQPVQPPPQQQVQSPSTTICPNCQNTIQYGILTCPICRYNFSQPPPQQGY
jgi:hypothetical protein